MVVVEEYLTLLGKITKEQLRFLPNQSTVFTQDPSFPPSPALASTAQAGGPAGAREAKPSWPWPWPCPPYLCPEGGGLCRGCGLDFPAPLIVKIVSSDPALYSHAE